MKKTLSRLLPLLFVLMITGSTPAAAQCAMCRASVESNLKNGGQVARGLNIGVLFMLSMPYLVVGTIGLVWWRHRRKVDQDA